MPKTYNSLTVGNAAAGSAILASDHAKAFENINNYRVPPMVHLVRTTSTAAYTSGAAITWQAAVGSMNTDGMWSSGTNITATTAGVYQVTFSGRIAASAGMFVCAPQLLVNGTAIVQHYSALYSSSTVCQFQVSGTFAMAVNDVLTAGVPIDAPGGTTYTIYGTPSGETLAARISAVWLGQVS